MILGDKEHGKQLLDTFLTLFAQRWFVHDIVVMQYYNNYQYRHVYDTIILHNYSNLFNNIITIFINMWSSELAILYVMFIEWNNIPLITPTELLRAASPCFSLRNEHKKKKWQLHSRIDEIHLGLESCKLNEKSSERWQPCWCISKPLHDCIVCDTWTCIFKKKTMYAPF